MNDLQQEKTELIDEYDDGMNFYRGVMYAVVFYGLIVACVAIGYGVWRLAK